MALIPSEKEILKLISANKGISRKEISKRVHLSQASITKITKILLDQQYIVEGERISNGLGRKEVLLYSNPLKFQFLGVDIGGYKIRVALSDNNMNITQQTEFLMSEFADEENKAEALADMLDRFLEGASIEAGSLDAVGIGVTGIVDTQRRVILNIPNVENWDSVPVVSVLESRFGCPVFLEEGGRTMALAEKFAGKAKEIDDFIAVQIGFGLVAGIIINGQLLRGVNNVAGLLGHTTVDENGARCLCGNYGCLENIITFPMLEQDYVKRGGNDPSFLSAYRKNEKIALDVCIEAGKALGIALSNVVNLFNPQIIYLGGPVFEHISLIFEETKRTVILRASHFATTSLKLKKNSFGELQGVVGTLSLAKSSLID